MKYAYLKHIYTCINNVLAMAKLYIIDSANKHTFLTRLTEIINVHPLISLKVGTHAGSIRKPQLMHQTIVHFDHSLLIYDQSIFWSNNLTPHCLNSHDFVHFHSPIQSSWSNPVHQYIMVKPFILNKMLSTSPFGWYRSFVASWKGWS